MANILPVFCAGVGQGCWAGCRPGRGGGWSRWGVECSRPRPPTPPPGAGAAPLDGPLPGGGTQGGSQGGTPAQQEV